MLSQSEQVLPQIRPASIKPLKAENDPTQYCYNNFVIDSTGRLWLKTCSVAAQFYDLHVLQYDGYEQRSLDIGRGEWKDFKLGYLEGTSAKGFLYGYIQILEKATLFT